MCKMCTDIPDRETGIYRTLASAGDLGHQIGTGVGGRMAATTTFVRGAAVSTQQVSQTSANLARNIPIAVWGNGEVAEVPEAMGGPPGLLRPSGPRRPIFRGSAESTRRAWCCNESGVFHDLKYRNTCRHRMLNPSV